MSRRLAGWLLLAALAGLPGCAATLSPGGGLQRDVDSLRLSVDRLRQEQAATRSRVEEMAGQTPAAAPEPSMEVLAMRDRLDVLEAQVHALARRLEGSDEQLGGISYELERIRLRLEQMSRRPVPLAGSEPEAAPPPAAPPPDPSPAAAPPTIPAGEDPAGIFQKAYADYTRGDYDLAALGFGDVLQRRPQGELADDAVYYLAEIAAARGKREEALQGYARVVQDHPRGDKVPPALLKRGLLLMDANRIGEGVVLLDHLVKTYPDTDEARLARNKLRALGVGP